jgi:hypothetical protein
MRRGTTPGQGANVCDLGRAALSSIKPRHFSDVFNDSAEAKINDVAEWHP